MKKFMKFIPVAALMVAGSAGAASFQGITVNGVGCDQAGSCYANISPAVATTCANGGQVRWDGTTAVGKNWTAVMMTAKAAALTVNLGTIDGVCNGNFPSLNFVTAQ